MKGTRLYDLTLHPGDLIRRTFNGSYGIFLGRNSEADGNHLNGWMLTPNGPEEITWAMEFVIVSRVTEAVG